MQKMPTFQSNGKKTHTVIKNSKADRVFFPRAASSIYMAHKGESTSRPPSPAQELNSTEKTAKTYKTPLLWQQWYCCRTQQGQASLKGEEEYEEEYLE